MEEARSGPGLESGGGAMGDGVDPTQREASANPGLRQQAMDSVRGAREQVTTQLRDRAGTAREGATRVIDERKRTLADSVHALASAFDAAAASLSDGQQTRLAEWTRDLSGRAHRIAGYLEEQDTRGLVTDLEGTARQHPTAFLGTTFAAGLAAGRFLRSSTGTDTGIASERGVDFEFHPDAALLADDSPEAASFGGSTVGYTASGTQGSTGATGESFGSRLGESGGYGNPGSGYGATGSSVGATRSGPGDAGFGPTRTEGGEPGTTYSGGHIGTGGAAMASRAAGSAPIGAGTGGLNQGGSIGDDLNSTDPESAQRILDASSGSGASGGSRGTTGGTSIDSGSNSDATSNPQRPTGGREGL